MDRRLIGNLSYSPNSAAHENKGKFLGRQYYCKLRNGDRSQESRFFLTRSFSLHLFVAFQLRLQKRSTYFDKWRSNFWKLRYLFQMTSQSSSCFDPQHQQEGVPSIAFYVNSIREQFSFRQESLLRLKNFQNFRDDGSFWWLLGSLDWVVAGVVVVEVVVEVINAAAVEVVARVVHTAHV